jgi:uncharacterized membrane protein (UPF0127 family)
MNQAGKILSRLRGWFGAPDQAYAPDTRMLVSNVTRKTILGTQVEVADSGPKRNKGLLGRTGLPPGGGLWIIPCESVHTFAMRFPIDLVYLDRDLRIKKVKSNVRPWRFSGCMSAHSVLELSSGTIAATETRAGDRVKISAASPSVDNDA